MLQERLFVIGNQYANSQDCPLGSGQDTDQHLGVRGGQGQPISVTTYTKELSFKLEKKLTSQNVSLEKTYNKVIVSIK